jgi:UDPglucose 6-dehydrogenase
MRLAIIGTGYVGLVAGAGFADFGNDVTCVDLDEARIAGLSKGEIPIHEPGLAELVRENLDAGRLVFTTRIAEAVAGADVIVLAVGTPQAEGSGRP